MNTFDNNYGMIKLKWSTGITIIWYTNAINKLNISYVKRK